MPKEEAEAKLQELEKRLGEGWNKLHSIKESHLEAVRDVVREQWGEEQKKAAAQKDQAARKRQARSKSQKQERIKRLDRSQDDGMTQ